MGRKGRVGPDIKARWLLHEVLCRDSDTRLRHLPVIEKRSTLKVLKKAGDYMKAKKDEIGL